MLAGQYISDEIDDNITGPRIKPMALQTVVGLVQSVEEKSPWAPRDRDSACTRFTPAAAATSLGVLLAGLHGDFRLASSHNCTSPSGMWISLCT